MQPDKSAPTPEGWTRNAQGFDEAPNSSPGLIPVLLFFGGIGALIFAVFLISRFVA
jgi:hypothetical protein